MATLSETAYVARKAINVSIILLVLIVILRVLFSVAVGLKERFFPTPPPPATVAFGKLPAPNSVGSLATPSAAITYTLETVDGSLPTLPPTLPVYFMPKPGPSFGSFDKMTAQAAKIGFNSTPTKTGSTSWRFTDPDNPLRTLDIDEISGNFRLSYNYVADQGLFNEKNFPSIDGIVNSNQSFFDGLGVLASDIKAGTPSKAFFRFDAGTLVLADSLSNADAIGVTFNRADLADKADKKFPVVSPNAQQGLVSILSSGSNDAKKKVLEARFFYSSINQEESATYPLITASAAWDKLKAGQVIFASLPSPVPTAVTIRQVYVAYLDPYPAQAYLQPVLVFTDQKGFVALIPIVSPDWWQ